MTTGLTVLISADMEGISGIVYATQTNPGGYDYERSRRLMTGEVNAAVAGVLDAEPDAVVLVADAHGLYRNLLVEELHSVRPYGPYTVDLATLVPGSARTPGAYGDIHQPGHGRSVPRSSCLCSSARSSPVDPRMPPHRLTLSNDNLPEPARDRGEPMSNSASHTSTATLRPAVAARSSVVSTSHR